MAHFCFSMFVQKKLTFSFFFLEPLLLVFNVLTTIVPTPTSVGECEDGSHKYTVIVKDLKIRRTCALSFRSFPFEKVN